MPRAGMPARARINPPGAGARTVVPVLASVKSSPLARVKVVTSVIEYVPVAVAEPTWFAEADDPAPIGPMEIVPTFCCMQNCVFVVST